MKINFKNIIYAVAGGVLGLALFISVSKNIDSVVEAQGSLNILTTRGGTINLEKFQLSRENHDRQYPSEDEDSVLRGNNEDAIFRMVGSSIFDNFLSFGQTRFDRLFIGYADKQERAAKLAVNGTITIKGLAHGSDHGGSDHGSTQVKACVNDFGVIQACSDLP